MVLERSLRKGTLMTGMRLFLGIILGILIATYLIVDCLQEIMERTVTFETYDDAEARKFQRACNGPVRTHTRALKHILVCYKKKEL